MWVKQRTYLLGFMLLLVVLPQGMVPFLHAHTGKSPVTGTHAPLSNVSEYKIHNSSELGLYSRSSEESYAVQVGSELSNEDDGLALGQTFVRYVFWVLDKASSTVNFTVFVGETDRETSVFL
ncbi:MAG: hypothetical protein EoVTN8_1077 [Fluviibacter phosphoraccumulans EoVTN8]